MQNFLTSGFPRGNGIPLTDQAGRPLGPARLGTLPLAQRTPAGHAAQPRLAQAEVPAAPDAQDEQEAQERRLVLLATLAAEIGLHFDRLADWIGQDGAVQVATEAAKAVETALDQLPEPG